MAGPRIVLLMVFCVLAVQDAATQDITTATTTITAATTTIAAATTTIAATTTTIAAADSITASTTAETTTTTAVTTTAATTTTTLGPVADGSTLTYNFATGITGLTIKITFTQDGDFKMHCVVATSPTATEALERFCTATKKPKIYLVKGFTDCSALSGQTEVEALEVATLNKPNDDALETVSAFTFRDLSGNCMAILQAADALPTTTVATTTVSTTTTTAAVSTTTASATTTTAAASGRRFGRQDTATTTAPTTTTTGTTTTTAGSTTTTTTAGSTTTTAGTTTTTTTTTTASTGGCPASSNGREARLIMARTRFFRTFNIITLGSFTILSTGSSYVAPTIVNANVGSVVSFGNFGSFTYNPWGTLPYLQMPGWTVTSIYATVGGLFVLYVFGLLGTTFAPVRSAISRVFDTPISRKFNRFVNYSLDRTYGGLTDFVHRSIRKYRRRDERPYYYNNDYASEYVRDYDDVRRVDDYFGDN